MPTLNWLTRETDLTAATNTPYRLLAEEQQYSYGDPNCENIILHGDNLDALKALLPFYAGQVKCIYIDPPFNTGTAFDDYDDNLEHTIWLSIMYPRLKLLHDFLREDGFICIHLDDIELAYMKIIMDEIFGREKNYLNMIAMTTNEPSGFKATASSLFSTANYILMYAKNRSSSKVNKLFNKVFIEKEYDTAYSKVLLNKDAPYQDWIFENISAVVAKKNGYKSASEAKKEIGTKEFNQNISEYAIENAEIIFRTAAIGGGAKIKRHATIEMSKTNRNRVFIHPNEDVDGFYILNGEQILFYSDRISIIDGKKMPVQIITDVWTDISWTGIAREGEVQFKNGKKPEKLIQRIFDITTSPGDLVLDSFLGSGTTAAVAHKMGRRYIGIEMGEQAKTHCAVRLRRVIEGEQGGISEAVGWKGGGGFRFFRLGEAVFDSDGRIKSGISFEHLAAHIYFSETKTPMGKSKKKSVFLGIHGDTAYALLYNGILGDKSVGGGNVLTRNTLSRIMSDIAAVSKKNGETLIYSKLVVYGEASRFTDVGLKSKGIIFKQTPYNVKVW